MTEKHSPLKVVLGATGKVAVQIDEPLGLYVADCSMTDQGEDWAALIVRAVNGLLEAIAALELFARHLRGMSYVIADGYELHFTKRDYETIIAALAKLRSGGYD